MTRTITQMEADVRALVDDTNSSTDARFSSAQVVLAIERAATSIGQYLASNGFNDIIQTTEVQLTNSVATIPANDGVRAVYVKNGTSLHRVKQGNGSNRSLNGVPQNATIVVEYIAKHAAAAPNVTYASVDLQDLQVDKLCAYMAASDLKTIEGETNQQLERVLETTRQLVLTKYQPAVQAVPLRQTALRKGIYDMTRWYKSAPTTITLYT